MTLEEEKVQNLCGVVPLLSSLHRLLCCCLVVRLLHLSFFSSPSAKSRHPLVPKFTRDTVHPSSC